LVSSKVLFGTLSEKPVIADGMKDVAFCQEASFCVVLFFKKGLPNYLRFLHCRNGVKLATGGYQHELDYVGTKFIHIAICSVVERPIQVKE
jgi:hypothetical protein